MTQPGGSGARRQKKEGGGVGARRHCFGVCVFANERDKREVFVNECEVKYNELKETQGEMKVWLMKYRV